ncbi:hypothetical protein FB107DRAFT_273503 [Schizophyllum commune]
MRDPDSPWRQEGCPDPAYPNKKTECRTYKTKREVHRQKYHCARVTVVYNGEQITVFRDTKTSLFHCPCGSIKHARRHSRRLQTLCAREQHPSPNSIGVSPDSDDGDEEEEDNDNSEYTVGSDEEDRSRSGSTSGPQTPGKRKRSSSLVRTSRAKKQQRDPESSDSEEGLTIQIEKLKTKIRKQKLRGELRDLASKLKDLEHESDRTTIFRDLETGLFHCPCGAPKHARRHSRRLRSLCARVQHPSPDDPGPSPDSDGDDDDDEDDEAIDDHSTMDDDEDNQSASDNSVISVSDGLESSPPPRPPLRAGPASLMRRKNGQFAPRNSGSASTSSTRASANDATVSSVAYVGVQQPRIGRPPAHLLRARAAATASTQKPKSTVASSSQMPRKRKGTSHEAPATSTRAGKKRRRDPELPSDSEEDLKRQVEELEKQLRQLRKHKLRKELRDLAGQLDDLKRASG